MSDLDSALRTMLQERAADIATLPAELARLDTGAAPAASAFRRLHRTPLLVAATVIAVLTAVGVTLAVRDIGGSTRHQPTTHLRTYPAHVARRVALDWFGMAALPGYQLGEQTSAPRYRQLGVRPVNDVPFPPHSNGGAPWTAYITVYGYGRFDAHNVAGWTVLGHGAQRRYLGTLAGAAGGGPSRTLAWQYAPDRWTLVQGLTPMTRTMAALSRIADAVRPSQSVVVRVPFRLGFVPRGMAVGGLYQDLTGTYPTQLSFVDPRGPYLDISIHHGRPMPGPGSDNSRTRRIQVGGLPGTLDTAQGICTIRISADQFVTVQLTGTAGTADAVARRSLIRVLHTITWMRAPQQQPTLEQAIP